MSALPEENKTAPKMAENGARPAGSLADAQLAYDACARAAAAAALASDNAQRVAAEAAGEAQGDEDNAELREWADSEQRNADAAWERADSLEHAARTASAALENLRSGAAAAPRALARATGGAGRQAASSVPQQMFPPCTIVRNLIDHFFRYRALELAARGLAPDGAAPNFTEDRVIGDMERFQYTRIDARRLTPRGKRDWVVILVLGGGGKYSRHSPDLRRLLGGVETEAAAKAERLDELLVVAEEDFFARKALMDLLSDLQVESAAKRLAAKATTVDPAGVAAFYNVYPYRNFSVIVPEHKAVSPHTIMAPEAAAALLAEFYLTRSDLPAIYASDPPLVWLGAREGDVVKIVRRSQTAGTTVYYRRVERGVTA